MSGPGFWYAPPDRPGPLARALAPVAWLCARLRARSGARAGWGVPVPVIALGAPVAGDESLMPALEALIGRLKARGRAPAVVMPGTGARRRVDPGGGDAAAACLAAAIAPTIVARDPVAGARALCADEVGADCLVIAGAGAGAPRADLAVIAVAAVRGFGNGRSWPAGPLCAPLAEVLGCADLLVSIGPAAAQAAFGEAWAGAISVPRLAARMEALRTGMDWRGLRVMVLAGGKRGAPLLGVLRGAGAEVVREVALPAEGPVRSALMARLLHEAALRHAQPVTTELDAARLPADQRRQVLALPMRMTAADWRALDAALDRLDRV